MRAVLLGLVLIVSACGVSEVVSSTTSALEDPTTEPVVTTTVPAPTTTALAQDATATLPGSMTLTLRPDGLSEGVTFGMNGDEVVAALSAVLGPTSRDDREQFVPLDSPAGDNTYGDAPDGLGAVSEFPHYRVACWEALCIEMDSADGSDWTFAAWRYGASGTTNETSSSDALTTSSGVTIGTTFGELLAQHPEVTVDWGEGDSVGFTLPGWEPRFNGAVVATGTLDTSANEIPGFADDELDPGDVPDDVPVESLFVGNGVDYGCC